jgi:hypothetical protein
MRIPGEVNPVFDWPPLDQHSHNLNPAHSPGAPLLDGGRSASSIYYHTFPSLDTTTQSTSHSTPSRRQDFWPPMPRTTFSPAHLSADTIHATGMLSRPICWRADDSKDRETGPEMHHTILNKCRMD